MVKASKDYSKGKVYMIRSKDEDCVPYVGSTTKQYLSQRMDSHRDDYKKWKRNPEKYSFLSSFTLFEKFGIENCFIELIELFPCSCNDELRKKEREWFDKLNCVNIVKPFISKEERVEQKKIYGQENKEQIAERMKEWCEENKEELAEKKKIYYDEHKEEILKKNKEYRDEHKEEIIIKDRIKYHKNKIKYNEKKKETYECLCGSVCRKSEKARHERTLKHQNYLAELTVCVPAIA